MEAESKRRLWAWLQAHPPKGTIHRVEFFVNRQLESVLLVVSGLAWFSVRAIRLIAQVPTSQAVSDAMTLEKANEIVATYIQTHMLTPSSNEGFALPTSPASPVHSPVRRSRSVASLASSPQKTSPALRPSGTSGFARVLSSSNTTTGFATSATSTSPTITASTTAATTPSPTTTTTSPSLTTTSTSSASASPTIFLPPGGGGLEGPLPADSPLTRSRSPSPLRSVSPIRYPSSNHKKGRLHANPQSDDSNNSNSSNYYNHNHNNNDDNNNYNDEDRSNGSNYNNYNNYYNNSNSNNSNNHNTHRRSHSNNYYNHNHAEEAASSSSLSLDRLQLANMIPSSNKFNTLSTSPQKMSSLSPPFPPPMLMGPSLSAPAHRSSYSELAGLTVHVTSPPSPALSSVASPNLSSCSCSSGSSCSCNGCSCNSSSSSSSASSANSSSSSSSSASSSCCCSSSSNSPSPFLQPPLASWKKPVCSTPYRICIVSDFFFPRLGGVELHQYQVAQGLMKRGHHVIIVTGTYGDSRGQRQGVRYLTNGLKVYYCPQMQVSNQASFPTFLLFFPLFRQILLRERIQIVHGHQATSALAHECILFARTMGLKALYTDHSLFGFADAGAINVNKALCFTLADISHVVCVSHCSKENLVLRACLNPQDVSVIPNAVDTSKFTPSPESAPPIAQRVNIVILSRLAYRKGVDLAVEVIPEICRRFPNVYWIIGGDGNKRLAMEEMREKHMLQDRVEMLGAVQHHDVRNVLVRGHLFLNCSLTEAFCIAILEAVSCGLFVVSTRVGGVPEVLPEHMIKYAEPNAADIVEALSDAIPIAKNIRPQELHRQVKEMYNWHNVAARTEAVYDLAMATPDLTLMERLQKHYACGVFAGKIFCAVVAVNHLFLRILEWMWPASEVDPARSFPTEYYQQVKDKL